MQHSIKFQHTTPQSVLQGFETRFGTASASFGEGGYDVMLFMHDIFEHSLELCEFFNSGGLHIEGESFALGMREYHMSHWDNSVLCDNLCYNKHHGHQWNTRQVIAKLIEEDKEGEGQYSVSGEFTAKLYTGEYDEEATDFWEGLDIPVSVIRAYSAGYETATKLFGPDSSCAVMNDLAQLVVAICEDFKESLDPSNPYDKHPMLDSGASITIKIQWSDTLEAGEYIAQRATLVTSFPDLYYGGYIEREYCIDSDNSYGAYVTLEEQLEEANVY